MLRCCKSQRWSSGHNQGSTNRTWELSVQLLKVMSLRGTQQVEKGWWKLSKEIVCFGLRAECGISPREQSSGKKRSTSFVLFTVLKTVNNLIKDRKRSLRGQALSSVKKGHKDGWGRLRTEGPIWQSGGLSVSPPLTTVASSSDGQEDSFWSTVQRTAFV